MGQTELPGRIGRVNRFHKILARLRQEDCPGAEVLSSWLGVCAKTIQRDLMFMRDKMHWPVKFDKHKKGWLVTNPGFYLPVAFASKKDVQAVFILAELVSQYAGTPLGESMQTAFTHLLEFHGKEENIEKVRSFARKVCFASPPAATIKPEIWTAISCALQEEQPLQITYRTQGTGQPKQRKFNPYGLIVRNRDWFLHGFCHQKQMAITLFVPYIVDVKVLEDEYFDLPKGFNLAGYVKAGFMGLQAGREPKRKVVLRFVPEAAGAAQSAPFMPDQEVVVEEGGWLRVTFETNALFQIEREVMKWGEKVMVVEPGELREKVVGSAKAVVEMYGRGSAD